MVIHSPKELAIMAANQRKKLGLTQSEIADKVGLKQKTISAFENNPESVMLTTTFLILSSLHFTIELKPKNKDNELDVKWDQEW